MMQYFHSVKLNVKKCIGCTICIKHCPTEAIRVHDGKAAIMDERCIDCGECIKSCPHHAKYAHSDTLKKLSEYKYNIALPDPSFFGQFKEGENIEDILQAFLNIGFDEVFEVSLAAEIVAYIVSQKLRSSKIKKPIFSTSCPAVLRLMQIKFPGLLEQTTQVLSPMEIAARIAKDEAVKKTGIAYDEIGAIFISPCPAKVTEARQPITTKHSAVNGVIGAHLIYRDIIKNLHKGPVDQEAQAQQRSLHKATKKGMSWGYLTGEPQSIEVGTTLAVSGVQNVMSLLEEIERGELQDVDFIEMKVCDAGCVGGPLNIQNSFVGRVHLRGLIARAGGQPSYYSEEELRDMYGKGHFESTEPILPRPIMTLDEDVAMALVKMERLDQITKELPGLDCGACGCPSCRALAEDIIRGTAFETDCVIKLRDRIKILAQEILYLARIVPPSMAADHPEKKEGA
ncbi:[Fe-Fe] hydrogenase large subunit C-terminal domain-containing protein [Syntrophus sp. (in: bacteria)]|uniref:[Fe-Fe] hydrogenase large subunit C-terminal domain-containing protein n=1 Tax=Syntrophus sp. (in: bacteria) TaxID=48412 RepID=UPI00345E95AE